MTIPIADQHSKEHTIILELSNRLKDPFLVNSILSTYSNQQGSLKSTLSHGYPSLVVLYSALDRSFPNQKWEDTAHQYILLIKKELETEGVQGLSLFGGLAGICYSILQASKGKTRYQKLLNTLNERLIEQTQRELLPKIQEKLTLKIPVPLDWIDLMSGITGVGTYLLCDDNLNHEILISEIIKVIISLTQDIRIGPYVVPGWYTPRHYQFFESDQRIYPKGNFNMGMSHGIAGYLSFLSIASLKGIEVSGQKEAKKKIADWLFAKRRQDQHGYYHWIDRISFEEEIKKEDSPVYFTADAWCYGTAGICRSLYLAGKALNDPSLLEASERGFLSILYRENIHWNLSTPSFCHGYAGLLTQLLLMGKDLHNEKILTAAQTVKERIVKCFSTEHAIGFKDLEPDLNDVFILNLGDMRQKTPKLVETEKIGLLDGVVGILLSLLLLDGNQCDEWTRVFLLQGGSS